jgi:hypothetical protein
VNDYNIINTSMSCHVMFSDSRKLQGLAGVGGGAGGGGDGGHGRAPF